MRCEKCGKYIPEGLGMEQCFCGAELPKDAQKIEKENELPANESKAIKQKTQIITKLLIQEQKEQINNHIDSVKSGIIKKSLIWIILTIIVSFIRFVLRGGSAAATISLLICFVIIVLSLIAIFIYSVQKTSKLKKDLKEKKAIILSARVSSIEKLKGSGGKKYEYEIYLDENEANIEKVHFFPDNSSEFKTGDLIKLTLTPNAHFLLSVELYVKRRQYERKYEE